jgi:uncharacterized protein involved in response to NO
MLKMFKMEPYRVLFFWGALIAIVGVTPWFFYAAGLIEFYPNQLHSKIMVLGFLLTFVSGFLMTAVPKMTNTFSASMSEKSIFLIISIFFILTSADVTSVVSWVFACFQFVFLLIFFLRRYRKIKGPLPRGFIFIPIGLFLGGLGTAINLFAIFLPSSILALGKLFLYQGFILNLIVGLGSRLIPVLTRKSSALMPTQVSILTNKIFLIEVLFLNVSFIFEVYVDKGFGLILRFLILLFVLFKNFGLHKPSLEKTFLGYGIVLSALTLPLPYILTFFYPAFEIHFMHISYILGFAMLTLLVAMRVTLAHGGVSLEFEKVSKSILVISALFVFVAVLRVLPIMIYPEVFLNFSIAAAVVWCLAVIIWITVFGPILYID